jgi:hypothetical protein
MKYSSVTKSLAAMSINLVVVDEGKHPLLDASM